MSAWLWVYCALLVLFGGMIGYGCRDLIDFLTNYRGWWYEE